MPAALSMRGFGAGLRLMDRRIHNERFADRICRRHSAGSCASAIAADAKTAADAHWGRDDHRAGVEYRAARGRGKARADVRAHIHSGWRAAHQRGQYAGRVFETPASLACVYQLVTAAKTCNPSTATTVSHGGAHAIALVDAYDDPNAASDLAVFSTEFGLPASGDLLPAVTLASNLVSAAGGGEVSMSWGFGDFAGENGFDGYFTTTGVVYFSSSGDSAGISYPCTSPDVVCVGGTTISRNATTGNFEYESAWPDTGGGPSPNEPIPSYQSGIASIVGTQRGTPDLAFVADGRTPVWVYDTFPISGTSGTWWLASGTSVSAPGMAGIVNTAGHFYTSTNAELSEVYSQIGVTTEFKDIVSGNCGAYAGYLAKKGWDFCSGVGVNVGKTGK